MKTAIGLVTACSETFLELFPGRLNYPRWELVFTGISLLISNIGLSKIITLAIPVLYFLCPLAIVLILLGIIASGCAAAALELVRVIDGSYEPLSEWIAKWLPLYSYGLGWITPSVFGFIIGLIWHRTGKSS